MTTVLQIDRDAASAYLHETHGYDCGKAIREGRSDHTVTPRSFAAHREQTSKALLDALEECANQRDVRDVWGIARSALAEYRNQQ